MVRVEDLNTGKSIAKAQVTLAIAGIPPLNAVSDNNGIALIFIDAERAGQSSRLRVDATGYDAYRKAIELIKDALPNIVQLAKTPLVEPVAPPADAIEPTPTPTLELPTKTLMPLADTPTVESIFSPTPFLTLTSTPFPTPILLLPFNITDEYNTAMVLVPAGTFIMGATPALEFDRCQRMYPGSSCSIDDYQSEAPPHLIWLADFYIDSYEVTNISYAQCVFDEVCDPPYEIVSQTRSRYYGNSVYDTYPVIHIDWDQANVYCEWRGGRLPTEAEWEKAAHGEQVIPYPWGTQRPDSTLLNFNAYEGDTTQVGSYPNGVSPYGVYDMAGNVAEWVADFYDEYPSDDIQVTPLGPVYGVLKVIRGGGWDNDGENVRTTNRERARAIEDPFYFNGVGFRCATDP